MIRVILLDLDDTLYPEVTWRSSGFDAVSGHVSEVTGISVASIREQLDELDSGTDRSRGIRLTVREFATSWPRHRGRWPSGSV